MKKCPFCAEEIQDEAIKCRFCNEFLNKPKEIKWYFRGNMLFIAFLCVGPLMLPLVILHPKYTILKKTIITAIIIILTILTMRAVNSAMQSIKEYYKPLLESYTNLQ